MSEERSEYDVVEIDLPEYEEDHSAIPDVDAEASFAENKDEIFRRNTIIAAEEDELPAYRVKYPDKIDAEEIYPQNSLVHGDTKQGNESILDKIKSFYADDPRMKFISVLCALAFIFFASAVIITSTHNSGADAGTSVNLKASEQADDTAKKAHVAASTVLTNLAITGTEIDGRTFENNGTVFIFGSNEVNAADYLGSYFTGYVYGVYDAEYGSVQYTLWSNEPIPDEYKRLLTAGEKADLAKQGIIIGCYPEID